MWSSCSEAETWIQLTSKYDLLSLYIHCQRHVRRFSWNTTDWDASRQRSSSKSFKGGLNVTCQPYNAISHTTANHVYNVTIPSLETIISREVLWRSTATLKITVFRQTSDASGVAGQRPIDDFPAHADTEPSAANVSYAGRPTSYMSYPNNVLAYDMNRPTGTAYYHKPRGS